MKIAVIIDKSDSFLHFEKNKVLSSWGETEIEEVDSFDNVGALTLFGESPVSHLFLKDTSEIKKFVEQLESVVKSNHIEEKLSKGLIITTTVARVSTKKLEKIVNDLQGEVILAKESSKDKTNVASKILDSTSLSKEVKNFIEDYVGQDYDNVISFVSSVSTLPPSVQKKITVNDAIIRMPQPPGSVAPWEIEKYINSGDTNKMIEIYRRISYHQHPLVVIALLKNKMWVSYLIASVMKVSSDSSVKEIAEIVGQKESSYPFKLSLQYADRVGYERLELILKEILVMESKLKGLSSTNDDVEMEMFLLRLTNIIKN